MLSGSNTGYILKRKEEITTYYTTHDGYLTWEIFTTSVSAITYILSKIYIEYILFVTKPVREEYTNLGGIVLHRTRYKKILTISNTQLHDIDGIL